MGLSSTRLVLAPLEGEAHLVRGRGRVRGGLGRVRVRVRG